MKMVSYRIHLACWPVDAHIVVENIMNIAMKYTHTFGDVYISRLPLTRTQPEIKIVSFDERFDLATLNNLLYLTGTEYLGTIACTHEYDEGHIIGMDATGPSKLALRHAPRVDEEKPTENIYALFRYLTRKRVNYV